MMKRLLAFLLVLSSACVVLAEDTVRFEAVAPEQVYVGMPLKLEYTINRDVSEIQLPEFTGFDSVSQRNVLKSTQYLFINGEAEKKYVTHFSYTLIAKKAGCYTIQPATIMKDSVLYTSNALNITVLPIPTVPKKHLEFVGVPIDGTLSKFTKKMKHKRFTILGTENGTTYLKGDFAGFKNCIVFVNTLRNKDLVTSVGVCFPEYSNWDSVYENYSTIKDMLTTKYGQPTQVVEGFQGPFADGNNDRIQEVWMDRCKYSTTFKTEFGTIELFIAEYDLWHSCVMLKYIDKVNNIVVQDAAMEDL
jgi:hypothetical protein